MATTLTLANPGKRAMGLGPLGHPFLVFKRKFRWTMAIEYCLNDATPKKVAEEFVKVGARPQLDIEETEINYLHGKFWLPGKVTFQTMTVTYYDVAGTLPTTPGTGECAYPSGTAPQANSVFGWIASVYDLTDPCNLEMGSRLGDYQGVSRIILYDGCGFPLEGWLMKNVWPQSVNFGELDMASSDEVTIELTLRYSQVQYISYCPSQTITKCPCSPCQ